MGTRKGSESEAKLSSGDQSTHRAQLLRWIAAPTTPQRVVRRSQIVLSALDGRRLSEIAEQVGVTVPTVKLWIRRYAEGGPEALLHDAPGRGRHPSVDPTTVMSRLREANLLRPDGRPVSLRAAGAFLNVSPSAVRRALLKTRAS